VNIKRRYIEEGKRLSSRTVLVRSSSIVLEQKVSKGAPERVRTLKDLAYYTLANRGLLNLYVEFKDRIKQIAVDGGDRYDRVSMGLRYGSAYIPDLNQAIDLITKA
jgi:hypothetical protein